MLNKESKTRLLSELSQGLPSNEVEIITADSIILQRENSITKIPMRKCLEEIYVISLFQRLGIPTVEITSADPLVTEEGIVHTYTMRRLKGAVDLIDHGDELLTPDYYSFLQTVFTQLKQVRFKGFGAISCADNGTITTEFATEKELLLTVTNRAERRQLWPEEELDRLRQDISCGENLSEGVLTHTDILNNVLANPEGSEFYLIDPQTIVSSGNVYWDIAMYLIYANAFRCTNGLKDFMNNFPIDDWSQFSNTARALAYERGSYYKKYNPACFPGILSFLRDLEGNKILVGNEVIERKHYGS